MLVSGFGVVCVVFWFDGGGFCVFCVGVVVLSLLAGVDCSKVYLSLGCSRCGLLNVMVMVVILAAPAAISKI